MKIAGLLSEKISVGEAKTVAAWASGQRPHLEQLWTLVANRDGRLGVNALWVLTHLPSADSGWLAEHRDSMIDLVMMETHPGRRRMLLQILRRLDYTPDDIPTDFLDFCLSKINSESDPYAVRCFCMYAACRMCLHYPELIAELEERLDLLTLQPLSPGLRSALRQTRAKIRNTLQTPKTETASV